MSRCAHASEFGEAPEHKGLRVPGDWKTACSFKRVKFNEALVKIIRTGIFCLGICAISWAQQQDSADLQQIDPATGKPVASQAAPPQAALPQQPVAPATAPKPSPVAPPEAAADQAAPSTGPTISAAPELPKYPDVRMPGETGWSAGLIIWEPREHPIFNRGSASTFPQASLVTMQGTPNYSEGAEFGVALGLHNALRVSWFTARAAGDFTNATDLTLLNQTYTAGTYISTNYKVQNLKLSFEYLSWPYPVESRRFRLLTLWQLQYTSVTAAFDAPTLPLVDSSGNLLVDANGNPISYAGQETKWFIAPTLGLGAREYITKNLRLEMNASGFAVPHHWTIWDTDASLNYRIGHIEIRAGVKGFHYKTSTGADFFLHNTMISPVLAVRWYSD